MAFNTYLTCVHSIVYIHVCVYYSHCDFWKCLVQALGVSGQNDRATIKKKLKEMKKAQEKLDKQREKRDKEARRSARLPASTDSLCWWYSESVHVTICLSSHHCMTHSGPVSSIDDMGRLNEHCTSNTNTKSAVSKRSKTWSESFMKLLMKPWVSYVWIHASWPLLNSFWVWHVCLYNHSHSSTKFLTVCVWIAPVSLLRSMFTDRVHLWSNCLLGKSFILLLFFSLLD